MKRPLRAARGVGYRPPRHSASGGDAEDWLAVNDHLRYRPTPSLTGGGYPASRSLRGERTKHQDAMKK